MLDWLIRGAQVLDGTGADAFPADVGIKDGTIAAVGRLTDVDAAHVLDAQGRTLTPGFLDIHRHTDAALFRPNFGRAELAQGLTTLSAATAGCRSRRSPGRTLPPCARISRPSPARLGTSCASRPLRTILPQRSERRKS
ncbi:MAG: hypothetical protein ACLUVL_06185 [Oscillospiraceae bacterium]